MGCKALVTAIAHKTSEYLAMLRELAPELASARPGELQAARLPALRLVITLGDADHAGCLAFHQALRRRHARRPRSGWPRSGPACSSTTRSTSSSPAAPPASRRARRSATTTSSTTAISSPRRSGSQAGERLCIPVPLYHCFGMVMGNLGCITHAATMVYPSEGFDPLAVLEAVEAEGCDGALRRAHHVHRHAWATRSSAGST